MRDEFTGTPEQVRNHRNLYLTFTEKMEDSVAFIKATRAEQHYLWRDYSKYEWEEDPMGNLVHIGNINNNQKLRVYVYFSYIYLYGQRICLFEVTSRYADYCMVADFIKEKIKKENDTSNRFIYFTNDFYNVVLKCKELYERETSCRPEESTQPNL
jgi:hypothetical protein